MKCKPAQRSRSIGPSAIEPHTQVYLERRAPITGTSIGFKFTFQEGQDPTLCGDFKSHSCRLGKATDVYSRTFSRSPIISPNFAFSDAVSWSSTSYHNMTSNGRQYQDHPKHVTAALEFEEVFDSEQPQLSISRLVGTLHTLFNNPSISDVVFEFPKHPNFTSANPRRIFAHKTLLCKRSSYFQTSKFCQLISLYEAYWKQSILISRA